MIFEAKINESLKTQVINFLRCMFSRSEPFFLKRFLERRPNSKCLHSIAAVPEDGVKVAAGNFMLELVQSKGIYCVNC